MMKRGLASAAVVALLAAGGTAFAQGVPMIGMGTREIGLSGTVDFEDPSGDLFLDLSGSYGYFIQDNLELGLRGSYLRRNGGDHEEIGVGGFGELHFPMSNITVPYVGVDLAYSFSDNDPGKDEDAFALSPRAGVKWFVREYVAIDANVFFKWATEDLYVNNGKLEDTDWGGLIGLRVYFK